MALLYPILQTSLDAGAERSDNIFLSILYNLTDLIPVSEKLAASSILFLLFSVLAFIFRLTYIKLSVITTAKIVIASKKTVFTKYTESDYQFFVDNKQGDLLYRASRAPEFIAGAFHDLTRSMIEIVLSISVLVLLISISWKGTIVVLIFGVGYFFLTRYLSLKISYKAGGGMLRASEKENVILNEYLSGIKQINVFKTSPKWKSQFNDAITTRWKLWSKDAFWKQFPSRLLELVLFSSVAIISLVLITRYPIERFPSMIPMFGTFAFAVFRLMPKISSIGTYMMSIMNNLPNLEVIHVFLKDRTYLRMKNGNKVFSQLKSGIEFRAVGFTHKTRDHTLGNISLNIEKDKMTAIVGPSGSGKSTLVDLLLRLYDVSSGEICIDGINIKEYEVSSFLTKVGFVGQEAFIYNASIYDNIAFGNEYEMTDIIEVSKSAYAHEFIEELPESYDTLIGDRGIRLSGGEKQRIAIARAMVRKPQILVLDEATSSLDNVSEIAVQKAIDVVSENCTTVVIAHRLSTIQNADIIYVLDNGSVVESGSHTELIKQKGKYWELYRITSDHGPISL